MAESSPRLLKRGESVGAATLMTFKFAQGRTIIQGFLYAGLAILASRPKEGKSFLAIKLGVCLALGIPFLGFGAAHCDVLILSLEDTLDRIQDRLSLLPYELNDCLHFATTSGGLPVALFQELDRQLSIYKDIRVVIIDTLQKVRHRVGDVGYNADYEDLGTLKEYADEHSIAILLLHHTRKSEADTEYDRISGTTGITGVADTMMVLVRKGEDAKLLIKGREFEEQEIPLTFNGGNWERIDGATLAERAYTALPDSVKKTISLIATYGYWTGTCKDLLDALNIEGLSERGLSQQLRDHSGELEAQGIRLEWSRSNRGSVVMLSTR